MRGNGKIIQELEATFRGAGWNVIKVIWGSKWDALLARDVDGVLLNKMNTTVDGEFQRYTVESGSYIREHFFGPDPRLRRLVEHLSDDELRLLPRGGHDYRKLYAAYKAAVENEGSGVPTVILAKTIKGWTLGPDVEGRNATHQIKKMTTEQLRSMRATGSTSTPRSPRAPWRGTTRPTTGRRPNRSSTSTWRSGDRVLDGRDSPSRGPGPAPARAAHRRRVQRGHRGLRQPVGVDDDGVHAARCATSRADERFGARVVPIIPDEARTFGMDAFFRELKIYASQGQRYEPVDAELLLSYTESQDGQILEEGITEAGALSSFIAAGTSYAHRGVPMVPFYIFYSMFGFQRVGDLIWQAADARTRGFLLGATAGRTTLLGEGLQHQDGHSLVLLASTVPACQAYDPAFAYEMATVVKHGLKRMYGAQPEDVFYYLTLYNENYPMPPMPSDVEAGIVAGLYKWADAPEGPATRATVLFLGLRARGAHAPPAADELANEWDVGVELWSATSYKALRDEALSTERWSRLHPSEPARLPLVAQLLADAEGPIVAVTDFMKAVPEQIARFVARPFVPLGTDGVGRSDTRDALRRYFEVDAPHVVVAGAVRARCDGRRQARSGERRDRATTTSIPTRPIPPASDPASPMSRSPATRSRRLASIETELARQRASDSRPAEPPSRRARL